MEQFGASLVREGHYVPAFALAMVQTHIVPESAFDAVLKLLPIKGGKATADAGKTAARAFRRAAEKYLDRLAQTVNPSTGLPSLTKGFHKALKREIKEIAKEIRKGVTKVADELFSQEVGLAIGHAKEAYERAGEPETGTERTESREKRTNPTNSNLGTQSPPEVWWSTPEGPERLQ